MCLWFDHGVRQKSEGSVGIVRYADDFVCFFEKKSDAEAFYGVLPKRLKKFNLSVAPEKTKLFRFSKLNPCQSEIFEFLGFEYRWERGRYNNSFLQKRTAPKKLRNSLANFKLWIKSSRNHKRVTELLKIAASKMRGHYNYFSIRGNYEGINRFYYYGRCILFKWLNRRSQKRSYNWTGFIELLNHLRFPKPRVSHYV